MSVVRFTHPVDLPEFESFGLPVQAAVITLPAEPLRALYDAYVNDLKSRWGTESEPPTSWMEGITERFREVNNYFVDEVQRVAQIRAAIDHACSSGTEVELDDNVHLWWFCSSFMDKKRFVRIGCPACGRDYSAAECEARGWSDEHGQIGGTRVCCPADHNLYVCAAWEFEPRGPCYVHWVPSSIHAMGRPPEPPESPAPSGS